MKEKAMENVQRGGIDWLNPMKIMIMNGLWGNLWKADFVIIAMSSELIFTYGKALNVIGEN